MMLDLGRHGGYILASYAVTIILLAGLVWQSVRAFSRARSRLAALAENDDG